MRHGHGAVSQQPRREAAHRPGQRRRGRTTASPRRRASYVHNLPAPPDRHRRCRSGQARAQPEPRLQRFATIQQARGGVAAGGVVHVANGTYHGSLSRGKSVTILGQSGAHVVVPGRGTGGGVTVAGAAVTLANLTVQAFVIGISAGATVSTLDLDDVHLLDLTGGSLTGVHTVNFRGDDTAETFTVKATQFSRGTAENGTEGAIQYSGLANLNLFALGGADHIVVNGASAPLAIVGGDGGDTIDVIALDHRLGDVLTAPVTIDAGAGANPLRVGSAAATAGDLFTVTAIASLATGSRLQPISPFAISYMPAAATSAPASRHHWYERRWRPRLQLARQRPLEREHAGRQHDRRPGRSAGWRRARRTPT